MPVVLPVVAFVVVTLWLRRACPHLSLGEAVLNVALGTGLYLVVSSELLSLINCLTRGWLMVIWTLPILVVATWWLRVRSTGEPRAIGNRGPVAGAPGSWRQILDPLWVGLAFVIAGTSAAAIMAPPNSWDSMTYHMSRVMHWIEDGSLNFYSTAIPRQLHLAPGAEMIVAHLQLLSGSDRFANLAQLLSMLGSLCAVSLIAKDLGASTQIRRLSVLIAATIPMAVLQAATTQNDLVAGFWILTFVLFGRRWSTDFDNRNLLRASTALALAILCKSTTLILCAPFLCWFAVRGVVKTQTRAWRAGLVVLALVTAVNGGHWSRNTGLYGNPLGPFGEGERRYLNDSYTLRSLTSNGIRNLALQMATPWPRVNARLHWGVHLAHRAIGIDINDPGLIWFGARFHVPEMNRHEDSEGSPLHMALFAGIFAAVVIGIARRRRIQDTEALTLVCLSAALLFCLLLRWQPWHTRLHLPILMLAAPPAAVVLGRWTNPRSRGALVVLLVIGAAPCVLLAHSRPLFGESSIWTVPRRDQYFVLRRQSKDTFETAASMILASKSELTGLVVGGDDWEYPLWVMTAGQTRFVHVAVDNRSQILEDSGMLDKLDLIVCTDLRRCASIRAEGTWETVLEREEMTVIARVPTSESAQNTEIARHPVAVADRIEP